MGWLAAQYSMAVMESLCLDLEWYQAMFTYTEAHGCCDLAAKKCERSILQIQ